MVFFAEGSQTLSEQLIAHNTASTALRLTYTECDYNRVNLGELRQSEAQLVEEMPHHRVLEKVAKAANGLWRPIPVLLHLAKQTDRVRLQACEGEVCCSLSRHWEREGQNGITRRFGVLLGEMADQRSSVHRTVALEEIRSSFCNAAIHLVNALAACVVHCLPDDFPVCTPLPCFPPKP